MGPIVFADWVSSWGYQSLLTKEFVSWHDFSYANILEVDTVSATVFKTQVIYNC